MRRPQLKSKRPMADINIVPYIDVMLVLLVIFMITTPLLTQGVVVDLPKAAAESLTVQTHEPIIVSVDARGAYYLNVSETPSTALESQLLAARVVAQREVDKTQNIRRPVLVKGDQHVDYGKIVQVMVLLQRAGVENVGLMTEPGSSDA